MWNPASREAVVTGKSSDLLEELGSHAESTAPLSAVRYLLRKLDEKANRPLLNVRQTGVLIG